MLEVEILFFWMRFQAGSLFSRFHEALNLAATSDCLPIEQFIRHGDEWCGFWAEDLVPGCVIQLSVGSWIPADCQIIEGSVHLDLQLITGLASDADVVKSPSDWIIGTDLLKTQLSLVPLGARVIAGEAQAIVLYAGENTIVAGKLKNHELELTLDLRRAYLWYFIRSP